MTHSKKLFNQLALVCIINGIMIIIFTCASRTILVMNQDSFYKYFFSKNGTSTKILHTILAWRLVWIESKLINRYVLHLKHYCKKSILYSSMRSESQIVYYLYLFSGVENTNGNYLFSQVLDVLNILICFFNTIYHVRCNTNDLI